MLAGGSYDWNGRGIDDLEPSPDVVDIDGGPAPVFTALDFREYRYYRIAPRLCRRRGLPQQIGASAYVRGLFSNFKNYGDRWVYAPGAGDFLTPTTTADNGTMDASLQNRRPNEQVFSISAGAKHALGSLFIDYEVSGVALASEPVRSDQRELHGP